jgi:hypothetical protein
MALSLAPIAPSSAWGREGCGGALPVVAPEPVLFPDRERQRDSARFGVTWIGAIRIYRA